MYGRVISICGIVGILTGHPAHLSLKNSSVLVWDPECLLITAECPLYSKSQPSTVSDWPPSMNSILLVSSQVGTKPVRVHEMPGDGG